MGPLLPVSSRREDDFTGRRVTAQRIGIVDEGSTLGRRMVMAGYEEWRIDADGLIAESTGHFDEAEYQRQLKSGSPPAS